MYRVELDFSRVISRNEDYPDITFSFYVMEAFPKHFSIFSGLEWEYGESE
jgi:hypothetical protein